MAGRVHIVIVNWNIGRYLRECLESIARSDPRCETVERVTGSRIDPEPYLRYLRGKFGS